MSTQEYRTRTMIEQIKNPSSMDNIWGVAVDIGYSGTKLISPNINACFPTFAVPLEGMRIELNMPDDNKNILYRENAASKVWLVGKEAQDILSPDDTDNSSGAIYNRNRYYSPMFLVVARVAMAIASKRNEFGDPTGKHMMFQTGLPNEYIKSDTEDIKNVLSGTHTFDVKIGNGKWEHFEIKLSNNDILVMPQPMGTLLSLVTSESGQLIPDFSKYLASKMLIIDPGFGTTDCITMRGQNVSETKTYTDFSMREVLQRTSDRIFQKYHVEIPVPAMQPFLERGTVSVFDRAKKQGAKVDFTDILDQASEEVAKEAIETITNDYNIFNNSGSAKYNYIVVTGGTGEAWYSYFEDAFSWNPDIQLLKSNMTNHLPFYFSNVRGYYAYLQSKILERAKKGALQTA